MNNDMQHNTINRTALTMAWFAATNENNNHNLLFFTSFTLLYVVLVGDFVTRGNRW